DRDRGRAGPQCLRPARRSAGPPDRPRAGRPWITSTGPRQAHLEGFDLHANVAVAADNRDGLEQLARYVLRPPIAQERLTRTADGRVLLTLKAEWTDGTNRAPVPPRFGAKERMRYQLPRAVW